MKSAAFESWRGSSWEAPRPAWKGRQKRAEMAGESFTQETRNSPAQSRWGAAGRRARFRKIQTVKVTRTI